VLRTPWDLEEADPEETFSSDGVRDDVSFESDRMNILEVNGKQRSGIDPATGIDGIDR
jgi:hypothetical protein